MQPTSTFVRPVAKLYHRTEHRRDEKRQMKERQDTPIDRCTDRGCFDHEDVQRNEDIVVATVDDEDQGKGQSEGQGEDQDEVERIGRKGEREEEFGALIDPCRTDGLFLVLFNIAQMVGLVNGTLPSVDIEPIVLMPDA
ncbi:unnamed protein product [Soboliphyme baturini]|uniref:Uncharacterized protein n=1 Tax=Soboliphyme baturini TaxID=241478 RepID=A0A183IJ26_9BILA|nr:unnamed protein product [Soboliphyme baturini]